MSQKCDHLPKGRELLENCARKLAWAMFPFIWWVCPRCRYFNADRKRCWYCGLWPGGD